MDQTAKSTFSFGIEPITKRAYHHSGKYRKQTKTRRRRKSGLQIPQERREHQVFCLGWVSCHPHTIRGDFQPGRFSMIEVGEVPIFLRPGATDGRKAIDGLFGIIQGQMKGAVSASWEIGRDILEPFMPWNVTQDDLSLVTEEYRFIANNMIPFEEYEARMGEMQSQ